MTPVGLSSEDSTRAQLLKEAKKVFAEKGFDGATVKDICEAAGLNVSLVSYHFGGKEKLYAECLEDFGQDRLAAIERILKVPASFEELRTRLEMFTEEFIVRHLEDPDLSTILHRECTSHFANSKEVFVNSFVKIFETFEKYLKTCQTKKLLKADGDVFLASHIYFGALIDFIRKDPLMKEIFHHSLQQPKFRERVVSSVVNHLLSPLRKE